MTAPRALEVWIGKRGLNIATHFLVHWQRHSGHTISFVLSNLYQIESKKIFVRLCCKATTATLPLSPQLAHNTCVGPARPSHFWSSSTPINHCPFPSALLSPFGVTLSLCFQLTPPSPLPLLNITLTRSPRRRRSTPILYFSTPRFYSYRVRIQISSFPIWKCRITTYLLRLRRLIVPALTLHVLCITHLFHDRYISGSSCIVTLLI